MTPFVARDTRDGELFLVIAFAGGHAVCVCVDGTLIHVDLTYLQAEYRPLDWPIVDGIEWVRPRPAEASVLGVTSG